MSTNTADKPKKRTSKKGKMRSFADPGKTIDGETMQNVSDSKTDENGVRAYTNESAEEGLNPLAKFHFLPGGIGLEIEEGATLEEAGIALQYAADLNKGTMFAIGDICNFAERKFGEAADQIESATGL